MSKISKQGSPRKLAIVLLSIALVFSIGFIIVQNFVIKPNQPIKDTQIITVSKPENSDPTETKEADSSPRLTIDQWNVGGNYQGDADLGLKYKIVKDGYGESANFIGKNIADIKFCNYGVSGSIMRAKLDEKRVWGNGGSKITAKEVIDNTPPRDIAWSKAGNYYYIYLGPQSTCGNDKKTNDLELRLVAAVKELTKNLKAL